MSAWQSGYIQSNGLRLYYTRTGGDKPPVVLSHGITDDGLCWTPVAQRLAASYDVIMVDSRGHGRSDAPGGDFGPLTQAADLAGVIKALGLQHPALLGHSMGALTTIVLAGVYPHLPGGIILEDPPGWWAPDSRVEPADNERLEEMRSWMSGLQKMTREELIAEQRAASPSWSQAELEPWADSKLRFQANVTNLLTSLRMESIDWPAVLAQVRVPALLITADTELGAALTQVDVAALQALVPHVQVEEISGAGHNIRREQFEAYMQLVESFLEKITSVK